MYDLVDRYLRRLDQELHKFKMELEADNRGITELLEKRNIHLNATNVRYTIYLFFVSGSLELDMPNGSHSQKENRNVASHARLSERERIGENRRTVG